MSTVRPLIKRENYINIQGWMMTDLGLRGNELICFAAIYGFSQDRAGFFYGSNNYLAAWCNCNERTIRRILGELCDNKLLIRSEVMLNGYVKTNYSPNFDYINAILEGSVDNDSNQEEACERGVVQKEVPPDNLSSGTPNCRTGQIVRPDGQNIQAEEQGVDNVSEGADKMSSNNNSDNIDLANNNIKQSALFQKFRAEWPNLQEAVIENEGLTSIAAQTWILPLVLKGVDDKTVYIGNKAPHQQEMVDYLTRKYTNAFQSVLYKRLTKFETLQNETNGMTAADIVTALRTPEWIPMIQEEMDNSNNPAVFHALTEFRVATGSSRHARRIDLLVAETRSVEPRDRADSVALRGIEIKVSVADLMGDHKMNEYTDFCDFFYIAVPDTKEMIFAAESVRLPSWGVLAIDNDHNVHIVKGA